MLAQNNQQTLSQQPKKRKLKKLQLKTAELQDLSFLKECSFYICLANSDALQ